MEMEMNKMGKMELLKQIMAVDFAVIDLSLYLNTHPGDKEAIAKHNDLVTQSHMLKGQYQKYYGMLTATNSFSPYPWQWINEPWPWEYDANFRL
ncbi:spore coat protein CotJB [Clostridium felsineum]|uniref:Uncharacterized protein n=1 Tax=Clostridium felsineum TaxID=36839 RepID=A0A1S8L2W2_9CLOT|nr:spore coat protein CotJB [Clostridium felsineum]MCR3758111.1 spore coat protein CotJB [Clostridium felsineum]URZ01105.1 hypothetical protein CLAUR_010930 [Clostridium felsineum]URZ06149.1 hypothetical protein CLROS_014820 [Clostridium felsineum]URZ11184.1 hypothetical protein CROST_019010 [Clostridium felsineum]URZ15852.1 hypothetical protein CLFE_018990 [Clostridium felsineum DSM 794]